MPLRRQAMMERAGSFTVSYGRWLRETIETVNRNNSGGNRPFFVSTIAQRAAQNILHEI
jgi:hypothetical protein